MWETCGEFDLVPFKLSNNADAWATVTKDRKKQNRTVVEVTQSPTATRITSMPQNLLNIVKLLFGDH